MVNFPLIIPYVLNIKIRNPKQNFLKKYDFINFLDALLLFETLFEGYNWIILDTIIS